MLVGVGGGLTVVLIVVELDLVVDDDLVAEDVFVEDDVLVVVEVFVVEEDLLEDEETEVDVVEETLELEEEDPEPEPGLGNVDPMSPQRTLLCKKKRISKVFSGHVLLSRLDLPTSRECPVGWPK